MITYPTFTAAVRYVWRRGRTPVVRGRLLRRERIDPQALALEVGAYVRYNAQRDIYSFHPGE